MIELSEADRFVTDQLCEELDQHSTRLKAVAKQLRAFAKAAPVAEQGARAVLASMPCVGPVTIDVVLAEAGDVGRFGSQRKATAYADLAPGIRESAGKAKQLGITKEGSCLLRTVLVETAWRLVIKTRRWERVCLPPPQLRNVDRTLRCLRFPSDSSNTTYLKTPPSYV